MLTFIYLTICVWKIFLHPIHISVTEIVFQKNECQVMHKVFLDDLEDVMKSENGTKIFLFEKNENPNAKELLISYFQKTFALRQNGQKMPLKYVGHEKEDDAVWVYFEAQVSQVKNTNFAIENNIFCKQLEDQLNIVYFKTEWEKLSFKLDGRKNFVDVKQ